MVHKRACIDDKAASCQSQWLWQFCHGRVNNNSSPSLAFGGLAGPGLAELG